MKIRSQLELQDFLDSTLADRKQELTTLKFLVSRSKRVHEKNTLLRASLPLVYAHWEGFIKFASIAYLDYVSRQPGLLHEYKRNFVVLACRSKIVSAGLTKKIKIQEELLDYLFDQLNSPISFSAVDMINTEANLSSEVLREIMQTVGLAFNKTWQTRVPVIDQELLKVRNEIAHGHMLSVNQKSFDQVYNLVIESLNEYKTGIENAAALESYKK